RGHGGNPCPRLVLAQARLVSAQLVSVRMRTWRVLKYQRLTPHGSASMGGGQYPFFETKVPSPPWEPSPPWPQGTSPPLSPPSDATPPQTGQRPSRHAACFRWRGP